MPLSSTSLALTMESPTRTGTLGATVSIVTLNEAECELVPVVSVAVAVRTWTASFRTDVM